MTKVRVGLLANFGNHRLSYPSLKELSLNSRNFSPDFVLEVLYSKPWLKLEKLSIKSYVWEYLDVFLEARLDHFPNLKNPRAGSHENWRSLLAIP
jgi:hypothetical protein